MRLQKSLRLTFTDGPLPYSYRAENDLMPNAFLNTVDIQNVLCVLP
jgi:hypothetical protein